MKTNNNDLSAMGNNQQGAVLIVVLLFLVLITLAGVMSVKNSNTDLRVATSDQVNTVLLQAADNANSKLEQTVNSPRDSDAYKDIIVEYTGVMSHFITDVDSKKDIISFCFKPRSKNFTTTNATVMRGGIAIMDNGGYCNSNQAADYTGVRGTTMTQVTMARVKEVDARFETQGEGKDSKTKSISSIEFDFYSTSILPALGSASASDLTECIEKSSERDTADRDGDSDYNEVDNLAVLKCMGEKDIVAKQIVERVLVEEVMNKEECKKHGGVDAVAATQYCPGKTPATAGGSSGST